MSGHLKGTFRSLEGYNYRVWAAGALVSNVGSWMQRTAQDWIVLTELTHRNATAVGIVMGLQFGPQILLLPLTGFVADHLDRRKVLFCTQAAMGLLALGLGLLVVTGLVQLWHVYVFAFLLGCAAAFDSPARQTFVAELVEERYLPNAVALNSTSFNAARMIGPADCRRSHCRRRFGVGVPDQRPLLCRRALLAGLAAEPMSSSRATARFLPAAALLKDFVMSCDGRISELILFMLFLVGTFGLNFPIFISTMSVTVFHAGASQYGLLTSMMAAGSVAGALMAAARARPGIPVLLAGAATFGVGCAVAAMMPNYLAFGIVLFVIGLAAQTFTTSTNSIVQTSTEPGMRGRVIAILLAIALGGTPVGAPIVGWIADTFGPRWALGAGAVAGLLAAAVAIVYLVERSRPGVDAGSN